MHGVIAGAYERYSPRMFGSGTVLWLTGQKGLVLSGSNVTGWTDQSTYGNNATTVSATNPTRVTTINSQPCVQFSRANLTQMDIANSSSLAPATLSISLVIRFQPWQFGNFGSFDNIIQRTSNFAISTDGWGIVNPSGNDSAGNLELFITEWDTHRAQITGIANNVNYILTTTYNLTAINFYVNGVLSGTTPYGTAITYVSPSLTSIGFANTWDAMTASLAEVVITNFALSTKQRLQLERGYFGRLYGIAT